MSQTPATALLRRHGVPFTEHPYDYVEHGGTAESARQLGFDEHAVVKTLVMQGEGRGSEPACAGSDGPSGPSSAKPWTEPAQPFIVLMHGDRQVSLKELARQVNVKQVEPCTPEAAQRATGYFIGGTSPFGTRRAMPVYVEASVLELPRIAINGGRRGYLVGIEPSVLTTLLNAKPVRCASGK